MEQPGIQPRTSVGGSEGGGWKGLDRFVRFAVVLAFAWLLGTDAALLTSLAMCRESTAVVVLFELFSMVLLAMPPLVCWVAIMRHLGRRFARIQLGIIIALIPLLFVLGLGILSVIHRTPIDYGGLVCAAGYLWMMQLVFAVAFSMVLESSAASQRERQEGPDLSSNGRPISGQPMQFTIRGILILTTVVAIVLAVGSTGGYGPHLTAYWAVVVFVPVAVWGLLRLAWPSSMGRREMGIVAVVGCVLVAAPGVIWIWVSEQDSGVLLALLWLWFPQAILVWFGLRVIRRKNDLSYSEDRRQAAL